MFAGYACGVADLRLVAQGEGVQSKRPVPAAKPWRINVAGLSFPKLQNGELVEFEVTIAADQIVMITRLPLQIFYVIESP